MRAENWPALLARHLDTPRPFAWGTCDCALWAADWVRDCTGADPAGGWRGTYKTGRGAKAKLAAAGFSGVEALADSFLPSKPLPLAGRGDVVLHPSGALGVCNGLKSHFLTASGMLAEDTLACSQAWTVG